MSKATVTGGNRLAAVLRTMAAKLSGDNMVEVGFIKAATEDDGTPVPLIAAINEFGGTVTIPEREVTIHRRLGREGEMLRGGRFVKAAQSNYATTHTVPEYTVKIPPRPYFRNMIAKESPHWGDDLGKVLVATNYDIERSLDLMGEEMNGELIESIRDFTDPPNAPSTIAKKGYDSPLKQSKTMLKSTGWRRGHS